MLEWAEVLRETYDVAVVVSVGAFIVGVLFGVATEISAYCTRSAVAEWVSPKGGHGLRSKTLMIAAAMLTALGGTLALQMSSLIDLSEAIFWSNSIKPVGLVVGGLLFGVGMVLARGCISRLLVLSASGNMRALVTMLVIAIASYATMRGVLSYPRVALEETWDTFVHPADLFADESNLVIAAALIAMLLFALMWRSVPSQSLKTSVLPALKPATAGLAIGSLVVAGWIVTGIVGADDFEPVPLAALSFTAPVAETVQYAMIFTGDSMRFGIALVLGTLVGAFASSVVSGRFGYQEFTADTPPVWQYVIGGMLMGFGGVTALGCTVGQGLSGVATASPASVIAMVSIVAGAAGAMKLLAPRAAGAGQNAPSRTSKKSAPFVTGASQLQA
ncbi:MAG: YeeE/YedE family protein [Ahrensia sp.]|nr:YeeE/YedE family protein [Ahrensia sp.]